MTPAGEGVHVVERPHNTCVLRESPEEGRIIDKIRDPVQIQNVIRRKLREYVETIFRAIGSKGFHRVTIGRDGRTKFSIDLFTPNAALSSLAKCFRRFEFDYGTVRSPRFADKHGRVDARLAQAVMQAIGGSRGTARDVIGAEVNDFGGSTAGATARADVILLMPV
jgi:hypothetical protein